MITVAIVGAGPAGLTLANLLQRADVGVRTVLIEHRTREQVERRARGGLLSAATVEVLAKAGLADNLLARGMRHDHVEFRYKDESLVLNIGELAGASQYVYPQQHLAADLIADYLAGGGVIHWGVRDVRLRNVHSADPEVSFRLDGDECDSFVTADLVAGCDGWRGPTRGTISDLDPQRLHVFTQTKPFEWMCLLARTPASVEHVVYGIGGAGLGLQSPRTPPGTPAADAVTRFYLSVPPGTAPDWSEDRVWDAIAARLDCAGVGASWTLRHGPLIEQTVMEMSATVTDPMHSGRVILLGDAAHPPTPVAAKGVSLAVHDAKVAADAIVTWAMSGVEHGLLTYSSLCLDHVWRTYAFTDYFTDLIHPRAGDADAHRRTQTWFDDMGKGGAAAEAFARGYVGPSERTSL